MIILFFCKTFILSIIIMYYTTFIISLSESIVPEDVYLNVSSTGEVSLKWSRFKHGKRRAGEEVVSIQKAPVNSTATADWETVIDKQKVKSQKYVLTGENADRYDYRIRIHKDDMSCRWIIAERKEQGRFFLLCPFVFLTRFLACLNTFQTINYTPEQ